MLIAGQQHAEDLGDTGEDGFDFRLLFEGVHLMHLSEAEGDGGDFCGDEGGEFGHAGPNLRLDVQVGHGAAAALDQGVAEGNAAMSAAGDFVQFDDDTAAGADFFENHADAVEDAAGGLIGFAAHLEAEEGLAGKLVKGVAAADAAKDHGSARAAGAGDFEDAVDEVVEMVDGPMHAEAGEIVFVGHFDADFAAGHGHRGEVEAAEGAAFEADGLVDTALAVFEEEADAAEVAAAEAAGDAEEEEVGGGFDTEALQQEGDAGEDGDAEAVIADADAADAVGPEREGVGFVGRKDGVGVGDDGEGAAAVRAGEEADGVVGFVGADVIKPGLAEAVEQEADAALFLKGGGGSLCQHHQIGEKDILTGLEVGNQDRGICQWFGHGFLQKGFWVLTQLPVGCP